MTDPNNGNPLPEPRPVFVDSEIHVLEGAAAAERLRERNDLHYLTKQGIVQVDRARWQEAQRYERKTWMTNLVDAEDDRNHDHKSNFGGYGSISGRSFPRVIELGCGPFTNLRLVLPHIQAGHITLLDPLIQDYLQHPHCTYRDGRLLGVPVETVASPIEEFHPAEQYDLVVMANVLEHCFDVPAIFRRILQCLKPGGVLLFGDNVFRPEQLGQLVANQFDAGHPIRVTEPLITDFLRDGFTELYQQRFYGHYDQPHRIDIYFVGVRHPDVVHEDRSPLDLPAPLAIGGNRPRIHYAYSGDPRNDAALRAPATITNRIFRFLEQRADVVFYDFADTTTVPDVRPGDIVLGHPHPHPDSIMRRLLKAGCAGRHLIFPFHTRIPEIARFVKEMAVDAQKLFLVSGPYWTDSVARTEYAEWQEKIVRLDNSIDLDFFALRKTTFNAEGSRGLLVLGRSGPEKGATELFQQLRHVPGRLLVAGEFSEEDLAILKGRPDTEFLGVLDWRDEPLVQRVVAACDFFINFSVSDASPTTLFEAMALGLIPVTTPQCGYTYPSLIPLSLADAEHNLITLHNLQILPEARLVALQKSNRELVVRNHNWPRFLGALWEGLTGETATTHSSERRCWCGGALADSAHPLYGKCHGCGTLVLRRNLTEAELKSFYGYQQYWHDHQSNVTGHPTIEQRAENDFRDRIPVWHRVLASNHPAPRRVLEIGCAHGGFLHHCRQQGSETVVGVEVDEATCKFARDHFGLPHVVSGLFPAVKLPVDQFDAVCGFDVIEHFLDPVEGLRGVAKILAPGGVCFFQTPCHRGEGGDWKQFRPQEHTFLYTEESVRRLFEKCGLEVVETIPGCFPDDMFIVGRRKADAVKSPASSVAAAPRRVKVAEDYAGKLDLTQIDGQSEFASAIQRLFRDHHPRRIVETGTYLGEGTTRVIADTLRQLGLADAEFHSIEINPDHLGRARQNLSRSGLDSLVRLHHGVSVPRGLLPSLGEIERATVRDIGEDDIFVDHREHERATLYFKETDFHGIPDDLLGRVLRGFNGRPDFVLLDSGGHMGNVEFNYLLGQLEGPCWIALDDVHHIKHRRSLRQMQQDGRFEIVVNSTEKFGFCIARFTPCRVTADESVQRLLWARTDSIGDAVLASSMLPHVAAKYPAAKIAVLCERRVADLYLACPHVAFVIAFDKAQAADDTHLRGIIAEIAEFNPQIILNSVRSRDVLSETLTLAFRSSKHIAIESDLANMSAADCAEAAGMYDRIIPSPEPNRPEVERHRAFLAGLGVEVPVLQPKVWTSSDDETLAETFFRQNQLDPEKTIAVFPGAQHDCRVYAGYAEALRGTTGFDFIVFGSAADEVLAASWANELPGRVLNLCGQSSLRETAALLRRCRLYVGAESAGAHIACAVGVPNVVILGGGHFGRFMPYSPLTSAVALPMDCYGCNWSCRHAREHCVKDIAPSLLAVAIRQTLGQSSGKPRVFATSESCWGSGEAALKRGLCGQDVELVRVGKMSASAGPSEPLENYLKDLEAALAAEDRVSSESILRAAFAAFPTNGELAQALANLQFQMGRFEQAIPSFKAACRLSPQDPLLPVLLAHCHLNVEDVEGFEAAIARSLEIKPGNPHALRLVGDVNVRFGRHAEAARAYGALVNQGEADLDVLVALGRCFQEIGQLPGAHACFTEVVRRQPAHPDANRLLAALEQRLRSGGAPVPAHLNQPDHEQVPCPACGSGNAAVVRNRADIVQCGGCQTVYLRTRLTRAAMRRLYQSYADDGSHMALPKSRDEAEKSGLARDYFLKEILTFIQPGGEFLDVGCGWGGFLLNARKHGFQPRGIELTRRCVGYASETLGIPVVETQLEDTGIAPDSLSVVTMNHVLEHLPEPSAALKKVIDSLKAGGMYCGIVPNFQSACSTNEGENWYWLDPFYHYTHFTPATLRRALETAGFVVERIYTATGDYSPENVRKGCLKADPKLVDDDYFKAELKRYESEGLGEEIRFFARKPVLPARPPVVEAINGEGRAEPLVSVVVSTCNSERFIRPCLENLARQTIFPQVEVIVVDSGSEQGERAIVEEFQRKHPNIRYVRTPRETVYGAWNRGLEAARGRYWVNANTDDSMRDDALEILVKAMDANASAQLAYVDCLWTSTPNDRFPSNSVVREVRYPDYTPVHSLFYCLTGCLQFWRTSDLRSLGGFDATYRCAGDYEIMTRLLERGGSALHVREFLSLFYQNSTGLTQSAPTADKEHSVVMEKVRAGLDISRVFRCRPGSAEDEARAWTLLSLSTTNYSVPWEDRPFTHHEYGNTCLERAIHTSDLCEEAWLDFAIFAWRGGKADEWENRLKGRWPKAVEYFRKARAGAGCVVPDMAHVVEGPRWDCPRELPALAEEPEAIRPWVARRDGRFTYLSHDLIPRPKGVQYVPKELEGIGRRLMTVLGKLPKFCAHFGGAGDGLLLLAASFDRYPKMPILSYPNSHAAARAFFESFPQGGQVYLLPLSADPQIHIMLRWMMSRLETCVGAGATPVEGYAEEWVSGLDLTKKYGIQLAPKWAAAFRDNQDSRRIAIAPRGSMAGMAGSKRNIIDPSVWTELLGLVKDAGYVPVVMGTPDEAALYPAMEGCLEARSRSFLQQMQEIGRCVGLIGADSWAKTFSALAALPTIVFDPLKGPDLAGWSDPADNVFIKPWPTISMVKGMAEFRTEFSRRFGRESIPVGTSAQAVATKGRMPVSWEGSFLDLGSLSHVNRELTDLLSADARFSLACVGANAIPASMRDDSDWKRRAKKLFAEPTGKASITVRHQWPPDWSRPANGALVVIQPWEFGSLPKEWVAASNDVDEFWVPSQHVRQVYISSGVDAAKVHVVPNGIDTKLYRPEAKPRPLATTKRFKLLFVGATIGRKGPDVLLQSYLASFTAADDVCLVIKDFGGDTVYSGQTMGALIEQARQQPNAPEILYLNKEIAPDEMPGLFTACDCLVHPYRGEGFGLPILEAMSCGLPVVVTQGGAADDFVGEANGWFIRSQRRSIGNSVSNIPLVGEGWLLEPDAKHLSAILREVVANPALGEAKGRAGATLAREKFSWTHVADIAANRLMEVGGRKPFSSTSNGPKAKRAMAKIVLPPCALLGHIGNASDLLRQRKHAEAWKAACGAVEERPFNPPAWEIFGEIAVATGDYTLAKTCLETLRVMAPGWKKLKELTRQLLGKSGGKSSGHALPVAPHAPRISVCLITKNEERFLEQCLRSVKDFAWEIIVVDTGSTDRTVEIAKSFGAKIGGFTWCDDFAAARNAALEMVRGDWVLVLDADEVVRGETTHQLKKEAADASAIAWRIPLFNLGREDQGSCFVPRLFRNAPALFYVGRIHEQIFTSVEVRRQEWGLENKMGRTELLHYGYTEQMTRDRNKVARNLKLLEKAVDEIPDDPNLIFNLGMEKVRLGRIEEGLVHYREAIRILNQTPADQLVPELREVCLTQFLGILKEARKFTELVESFGFPVMKKGGLTASMHYLAGFALVQLGRSEEAVKHLRSCLAQRNEGTFAPIHADIRTAAPHHCLAVALANLGRPEEAEAAFECAKAVAPRSAAVILDYARFEAGRGETAKALHLLHTVLGADPKHSMLWRFGAQVLLLKPELGEIADQWTTEALNHYPADRELLAARGEILLLTGRPAEAGPLLEQAAKWGPARLVAADALCRLACGGVPVVPVTDSETTREFLGWYRRLVEWQAAGVVGSLNDALPRIEASVPRAGAVIRSVLAEATV